jgi:hypothetical protein
MSHFVLFLGFKKVYVFLQELKELNNVTATSLKLSLFALQGACSMQDDYSAYCVSNLSPISHISIRQISICLH